jgi:phenylalanyl-tRNA synthetase beta chain
MNILIPHSWLLEHLETDASPQEIQKYLSLCGPSVERIYEREGEAVYDIEVTTNRVDCMSVRGIAREAAVILQQFGKTGKLRPQTSAKIFAKKIAKKTSAAFPLPRLVSNEKLCKRTMMIVLRDVERAPTPEWMAKRLRQIEMNVHDAVIDITNYVTHELGHPCHAFDYDRIMELGGTLIIKEAKKDKKFMTLDGAEFTTVGGEVVIENDRGEIIDLPSIKGTKNSSINADTRNILFFSDDLEPEKVRFASMTHAIRTVAAQLLEKNLDPELAQPVMEKGIELFMDLTGASIGSKMFDDFPGRKKPWSINVSLAKFSEYLGIDLPLNTIGQILEDLGCEVEIKNEGIGKRHKGVTSTAAEPTIVVTPPSFRGDLQIPADIIEEVARIYGYHNLPSILMPTAIPLQKPTHTNFFIENGVKHFLAAIGWQELYTYSMVSAEIATQSGFPLTEHLKIQNPLTDDRVYMRRSMIPSLEEVIANNPQRTQMSIFEMACLYPPVEKKLPDEELFLTLVSTRPFRQVKGDIEVLFQQFFISDFETAMKGVGSIAVLPNGHTTVVISIPKFIQIARTHPHYQPQIKTNEVIEDLTFTLPEKTEVSPLIASVKTCSPLIRSIVLKDIFQQNYSFTFSYTDPSRHLTAEDVTQLRRTVTAFIEKNYGAKLVGSIQ